MLEYEINNRAQSYEHVRYILHVCPAYICILTLTGS